MALLGNMIGAAAGRALAQTIGGVAAGPAGAAIGVALPFVARRLGPMGMVAMAVGAWAVTRVLKDQAERERLEQERAAPVMAGRAPADPAAVTIDVTPH